MFACCSAMSRSIALSMISRPMFDPPLRACTRPPTTTEIIAAIDCNGDRVECQRVGSTRVSRSFCCISFALAIESIKSRWFSSSRDAFSVAATCSRRRCSSALVWSTVALYSANPTGSREAISRRSSEDIGLPQDDGASGSINVGSTGSACSTGICGSANSPVSICGRIGPTPEIASTGGICGTTSPTPDTASTGIGPGSGMSTDIGPGNGAGPA